MQHRFIIINFKIIHLEYFINITQHYTPSSLKCSANTVQNANCLMPMQYKKALLAKLLTFQVFAELTGSKTVVTVAVARFVAQGLITLFA